MEVDRDFLGRTFTVYRPYTSNQTNNGVEKADVFYDSATNLTAQIMVNSEGQVRVSYENLLGKKVKVKDQKEKSISQNKKNEKRQKLMKTKQTTRKRTPQRKKISTLICVPEKIKKLEIIVL